MKTITEENILELMQEHIMASSSKNIFENIDDEYWKCVLATMMENWPNALKNLAIPFYYLKLTREEMICLGLMNGEFGEAFQEAAIVENIDFQNREKIEKLAKKPIEYIRQFVKGNFFIRLGSRSPKDSYIGYQKKYKCQSVDDAFEIITDSSERIYEDLSMALHKNYNSSLVIRPYVDIAPGSEVRCFIHQGICIGVSEYDYRKKNKQECYIADNLDNYFKEIFNLATAASEAAQQEYLVVDIGVIDNEFKVIEINPFFTHTDPCLYDWGQSESFQSGAIRVIKNNEIQEVTKNKKTGLYDWIKIPK